MPSALASSSYRSTAASTPNFTSRTCTRIGSYVRAGLIDEDMFLLGHWLNVLLYWSLLEPCMEIVRRHSPHTFENFEFLAARALIWRARHPQGNYPATLPRVSGDARAAIVRTPAREEGWA